MDREGHLKCLQHPPVLCFASSNSGVPLSILPLMGGREDFLGLFLTGFEPGGPRALADSPNHPGIETNGTQV